MLPAETTPRLPSGSTGWWSTFPVRERDRSQTNHTLYSGSDLKAGDVDLGKILMKHNGPSPPENSGPHRYVFVLYDQGRTSVRSRVSRNRAGFDLEKWSTNRQDLGKPIAGNFYFAEN